MKKVLLLYTSVGLGHKSIAENIAYHLHLAGCEVRLEDIQQVQAGPFASSIVAVHQFINRNLPFVWGWLYRWGHYVIWPFRLLIAGFNYKQTKEVIDQFRPDMVITTQTTSSAVVAYLKKKGDYTKLFGIAFHDYHLHPYWIYSQADFYLAIMPGQKEAMVKNGENGETIFVCGMTLQPKPSINVDKVRARLGLAAQDKAVLIASGSLGTAMPVAWLESLVANMLAAADQKGYSLKVVIACGRNKKLEQELTARLAGKQIKIFGYYQPIAELYAVTNVFLTKPGALSIAEGLLWRLPMLVTHWLPGQEAFNYTYLQEKKLIMPGPRDVRALKPEEIVERVMAELAAGTFRQSLNTNNALPKLVQSEPPVKAVEAIEQMFHVPI